MLYKEMSLTELLLSYLVIRQMLGDAQKIGAPHDVNGLALQLGNLVTELNGRFPRILLPGTSGGH